MNCQGVQEDAEGRPGGPGRGVKERGEPLLEVLRSLGPGLLLAVPGLPSNPFKL